MSNQPTYREQLVAELETIQKRWAEIQAELASMDAVQHSQAHDHLWQDRLKREATRLQSEKERQDSAALAALAGWQAKQAAEQQRQAEIDQVAREARKMFPNVRR